MSRASVDAPSSSSGIPGVPGILPENPKLLVIETGLVGELLVITPTLRAIKRAYPGASITVMVSPGSAPILAGNPAVSRLLPLEKAERTGGGLLRVAAWVRSQRFDAVLVLHTSFRSAALAALALVRVRAGLTCEGRGWLLTHRTPRDRSAYEVDEHLRVAGLLGIPPDGRELDLFLSDEERAAAKELLGGLRRPLVGLHPGASREIRRWPAERFAELGQRIIESGRAHPVYLFGPREQDLAETVRAWCERNGAAAPMLISPSSVRMLGALFERTTAVVTNNTGPMHVATAVRVPGVFIHGPTPVDRWHPPGSASEAVYGANVACRPCDSPRCRMDGLLCMEAVTVDEVRAALMRVLDTAPARVLDRAAPPQRGNTDA